jgi:hypothetical protein
MDVPVLMQVGLKAAILQLEERLTAKVGAS